MKAASIKFLLFLFVISLSTEALTQDKVLLMSGKELSGQIKKELDGYYDFSYNTKRGKAKDIELTKFSIFSVTDSQGNEKIIYKRDSLLGSFYTANEMKMRVFGQRDAHKAYKNKPFLIGGFALGLGAVLYDTYENSGNSSGFFKRSPSIAPILFPLVITVGSGFLKTKMKSKFASNQIYLNNEFYIEGFQRVAKSNRIRSTFFGSIMGVAAGFLVYNIAK